MSERAQTYAPGTHPDLPPPPSMVGVYGWMRANLFSTPLNVILTLASLYILSIAIPPVVQWVFLNADWQGETREACAREGACWVFAKVWLKQFMYGRYPNSELWRVNAAYVLLAIGLGVMFVPRVRGKGWIAAFLLFGYPAIAYVLFYGGAFGLAVVETPLWGGLFLTLVIASVGIVGSLPIGIVLALGRRSRLPIIQSVCVVFIEVWRGVPLITVLFMASVMFPLFMPEGLTFDKLARALIGVMLFSAAYMAEVVRGGLQAIPKGQYEAAQALGLNYPKMMALIVLPQALKLVIPGIVNTFIGLFKDTTLVLIIGLFDFLGTIQAAGTNPQWLGFAIEGYVFAALVFWVFCFGMSRYSQHLEKKLQTTR